MVTVMMEDEDQVGNAWPDSDKAMTRHETTTMTRRDGGRGRRGMVD